MSNWISKHLGFTLDSHSLANLAKNLSPVAGTIIGGPLGLAAAGGLSALGDLGRGKNIGEAVRGGLGNAALAAAGQGVAGHFGYHGGLGSLTGGSAPASPAPLPSATAVNAVAPTTGALPSDADLIASRSAGGLATAGAPAAASAPLASAGTPPQGLLTKAADFYEHHPTAVGMGLSGIGNIATSGAKNRAENANAHILEQQADESSYDFMRRKQRDEQLAPLWGSLGTAIGSRYNAVSQNPYLPRGA